MRAMLWIASRTTIHLKANRKIATSREHMRAGKKVETKRYVQTTNVPLGSCLCESLCPHVTHVIAPKRELLDPPICFQRLGYCNAAARSEVVVRQIEIRDHLSRKKPSHGRAGELCLEIPHLILAEGGA